MDKVSAADGGWEIIRYDGSQCRVWDEFVLASRNATFLHLRGYMDYHADRFSDHSLMAFKGGKLRAILPADITSDDEVTTLHSHRGLTYGGWLLPCRHIDGNDVLELFGVWCRYCRDAGISAIDYKPLPHIYARMPSDEDRYALARCGAVMQGFQLSETIRLSANPGMNTLQKRNLKKAGMLADTEVCVLKGADGVAEFHAMLSECLAQRHDASPVHSVSELQMLAQRFPDNIELRGIRENGILQAGVCLYHTGRTTHCQYIATTGRGRNCGLLTLLFHDILATLPPGVEYFDFGTSNEDGGRVLNSGLLRQKSALGGSGVIYPRYSIVL